MDTDRIKITMKQIILAYESPRRREILASLGVAFTVLPAHADESCDISDPEKLVEELARRKGQAVNALLAGKNALTPQTVILSADTVVACDGQILGKPRDADDALRMLRMLRGRCHQVTTGVGVTIGGITYTDHSTSDVEVDDIPDDALLAYVQSGDPMDKAGSYGIQGEFSRWVRGIRGCYFGIVGLPVNCLNRLYHSCTGEYLGR